MFTPLQLYIAEFFGTTFLVTQGLSVVASISLSRSMFYGAGGGVAAMGWGAAMTSSAIIVAPVSGAHCNPAFSIGFFIARRLPLSLLPGYIIAQILGATLAAVIVWFLYKDHLDLEESQAAKLAVFSTHPAIYSPVRNIASEAVATFALMITVLGFSHSTPANGVAFIYLFIALSGGVMAFAGLTGYAINPARDMMPRIIHSLLPIKHKGNSNWRYAWIPVIGPIAGASLAALVYQGLFA